MEKEKKKVYHAGKKLWSIWLTEEEMLKAKLLSKQYGTTISGLFRLIINQPEGAIYRMGLPSVKEKED